MIIFHVDQRWLAHDGLDSSRGQYHSICEAGLLMLELDTGGTRIWNTIKRHQLPFTHMGMSYEKLGPRHLFIHRQIYADALRRILIEPALTDRMEKECDKKQQHDLRSALRGVLRLCQTREDIYCDV
eukprot:7784731-Pyramimonas_sp.AAC.1